MCDLDLWSHRGRPYVEELGRLELWQPPRTRDMIVSHAWGVRVWNTHYVVPAGMKTDGASIPRLFWRILDPPMCSRLFLAAILHDAAYGGILRASLEFADWLPVDRPTADDLLRLVGRWNGYPAWKCACAWHAVRHFGGWAWRRGHARNAGLDLGTLDYHVPPFPQLPSPSVN